MRILWDAFLWDAVNDAAGSAVYAREVPESNSQTASRTLSCAAGFSKRHAVGFCAVIELLQCEAYLKWGFANVERLRMFLLGKK